MNNLQRDFLKQSIESVENLIRRLHDENDAGAFSESFSRQCFRALHTIKGTAQTFGFPVSGNLAHELENLLSVSKNDQSSSGENSKTLFIEGLDLLKKTFERKTTPVPQSFLEKIHSLAPSEADSEMPVAELPEAISSQLSGREKTVADSSARAGKNLLCLEIEFDLAKFAEGLTNFREALAQKCEIIATLPAGNPSASGRIGFQILLATAEKPENIKDIAEQHGAAIVFQNAPADFDFTNDLRGVCAHIAAHGESLARQLGKKVDFEIAAIEEKVLPPALKIVFDALLHLIRNAVDHAVETPSERIANGKPPRGQIKIQFFAEENNLRLLITDDGRGIDREKIRAKAVEKNLVSSDAVLSEQAALDLIFTPEFSTAEKLTQISGRGIGLDAVKDSLEKAGGKITVRSRKNEGSIFEIRLPAAFDAQKKRM